MVLDELVRPANAVLNYHTRFSGITAEMLAPVATTRADVVPRLRALLTADTLLVGHSLENDLRALKLLHGRVIDTVHLFQHPRGLPYRSALRILAERCALRLHGRSIYAPYPLPHYFVRYPWSRALTCMQDPALWLASLSVNASDSRVRAES